MNNPEMTLTPPVFLVRPFAGDRIPTERLSCVVYNFQSQCPPRRSPGLGAAECRNEDSSLSCWLSLAETHVLYIGLCSLVSPVVSGGAAADDDAGPKDFPRPTRAHVRVRKTIQECR